jgi:flagellar hook-associated protein 2
MAVDYLGALGAGSGIDSKNLVESLVAAERQPAETRINNKIESSERQISAYGTVMSSLQLLEAAFAQLNDASDFSNYTSTISNGLTASGGDSFRVTTDTDVNAGSYEISVTTVATPDRWVSEGFAHTSTELNDGDSFSLTIDFDDSSAEDAVITVTEATPQGIVDAINATSHGVSASIVDTGDASTPIRIVLTGELGADSSFTAATDISTGTSISFTSQISDAGDATFTLDGVDITRTSNMVDDLIAGATIELIGQSASTGVLQIAADTSVAEARIRDLVDSYNTVREVFKTLRDPDAADELAGSLSSDSLFRNIETAVREMVTSASSTPGDNLTYLSDIGVRMTREGTLEIDETDFTVALNSNYDDVVTMISADTDRQSMFGDLDRGIAGDAIAKIREFTNSAGSIKERTQLAQEKISNYEADLTALDKRMQAVSKRYLSQFTAMEQIVDRMNSTREYLKQQIESLPYSNRDS